MAILRLLHPTLPRNCRNDPPILICTYIINDSVIIQSCNSLGNNVYSHQVKSVNCTHTCIRLRNVSSFEKTVILKNYKVYTERRSQRKLHIVVRLHVLTLEETFPWKISFLNPVVPHHYWDNPKPQHQPGSTVVSVVSSHSEGSTNHQRPIIPEQMFHQRLCPFIHIPVPNTPTAAALHNGKRLQALWYDNSHHSERVRLIFLKSYKNEL